MSKLLNFFSIRPKMRKFLSSYYKNNFVFDLEINLRMRAANSTCEYIEQNMINVPLFNKPNDTIDYALNEISFKGIICEFGVYKGTSVN